MVERKLMLLIINNTENNVRYIKKINRLLYEPLTWDPIDNEETKYFTIKYSKDECWLQMNDFPDESLWTLFYKGKSIDIEDTPIFWKINYRNNKATQ